jgi:hypothetical protein
LVAKDFNPEDIFVCLDDDAVLFEAPTLVKRLVDAVEQYGAAAAQGRDGQCKPAPPGAVSRGELIFAAANGFGVRVKHLLGLLDFASSVRTQGGPDALGLLGDDDALVSAFLWKNGVKIRHAATGNIYAAPGMRASSQSAAKMAQRQNPDVQKLAIQRITGWPFKLAPAAQQVPVIRR